MANAKWQPRANITRPVATDPDLSSDLSEMPEVTGYLASIAMTVAATVIAVGIDSGIAIPNISLIFVVPVIVAGVGFGLGPSFCSALLGALAYNFFLTEPRYTLLVDDPANVWAIGLLFFIGLIVSSVGFTSERRASDAALLRWQTSVLQDYSRAVVAAGSIQAIASMSCQALAALFRFPAVVMLVSEGEVAAVNTAGGIEPQEAEFEAARSSLETDTFMRAETYPATESRFDFWPVKASAGQHAVVGLAFNPEDRPPAPDTLVGIVGNVLALALDRQHFPVSRETRSSD